MPFRSKALLLFSVLAGANVSLGQVAWSPPVLIDSEGDVGQYASLALNKQGQPRIAYYRTDAGDLKYAFRLSDGDWFATYVDRYGDVGQFASLAMGHDGHPRIAYYDATNGNLKYAAFQGTQWNIQVVDSEGDVGSHCSLALDSGDNPHIAYHDASNTYLKYATWDGSEWDIRQVDVTGLISFQGRYTSIDINPTNDQPHISYADYLTGETKHAWTNGYFWRYEGVYGTGYSGYYTSLKVSKSGDGEMSFCDPISGTLYHANKEGNNWIVEPVDTGNFALTGYFSSIALDAYDRAAIAYSHYGILGPTVRFAYTQGYGWVKDDALPFGLYYPTHTSLEVDPLGNPRIAYAEGVFERQLYYVEGRVPPPPIGWALVVADRPLTGLEVYGNENTGGIAAVPMLTQAVTKAVLPHFKCDSEWYTGLAMVNPNRSDPAQVKLTAYSDEGAFLGQADVELDPGEKVSYGVDELFGFLGEGWLLLESDFGIMAEEAYGNRSTGGLAAVEASPLAQFLYMPHFRSNYQWWTGIAIANPGDTDAFVVMDAYDPGGNELGHAELSVPAKGKVSSMVRDLFGLSDASGWVEIGAFSPVSALYVFGDRSKTPVQYAALSAAEVAKELYAPVFLDNANWTTSFAFANPTYADNSVHLSAYDESGILLNNADYTIPPRGKLAARVQDVFPGSNPGTGWVHLQADSNCAAIQIFSLGNGSNAGLGGLGFVRTPAQTLYAAHYHSDANWWTVFALGNPNAETVSTEVWGYDVRGRWVNYTARDIPPFGDLVRTVEDLFLGR